MLRFTLLGDDRATLAEWESAIRACAPGELEASREDGELVFVDARMRNLDATIERIDRRGRAIVVVVREGDHEPSCWLERRVDDLLVHPFRALEIRGKLRQYEMVLRWDEVRRLNQSFSEIIEGLRDDLALAARLQKDRLPTRFEDIPGFRFTSRYLAGERPGGDFFDLAESAKGSTLSLVLTDSSSHGLSSAVLSALVRVASRLSGDESRSTVETVRRIHLELLSAMSAEERLSMFYGIVSRSDYRLRYLLLGSCAAFLAKHGGPVERLPSQGGPLSRVSQNGLATLTEAVAPLEPEDRLVLVSDGFVEAAGGIEPLTRLLEKGRGKESKDLANELAYQVKSRLADREGMPSQDCSVVIGDVESRVLRLSRA